MYQESPFHYLTRQLLEALDQMNLTTLRKLTEPDFSSVEANPGLLLSRAEWLVSLQQQFKVRATLGIQWHSEMSAYQDIQTVHLACSMFTLSRRIDTLDLSERAHFAVTLIWRFTDAEWKACRWHAGLLKEADEILSADD
jgi:hypothetical protein